MAWKGGMEWRCLGVNTGRPGKGGEGDGVSGMVSSLHKWVNGSLDQEHKYRTSLVAKMMNLV